MPDFIDDLVQLARQEARARHCQLSIEYSHPTEAVYLRLLRQGYWFGLRVATHKPAYACSSDFQQLLLPVVADGPEIVEYARQTVRQFVHHGGNVVADPHEVQQEIQSLFISRSTATRHRWPRTAEVCAVRHRLNVRAAWSYEIETRKDSPCPTKPTGSWER